MKKGRAGGTVDLVSGIFEVKMPGGSQVGMSSKELDEWIRARREVGAGVIPQVLC